MYTEQGTRIPNTRTISSAHVHRTRDSRFKHQDYQFCTCPQNTGLTFQTPGLSVLHMSTEHGTHVPNTRTISSAHVHRTQDSRSKHQDYQFCTCPQSKGLTFQTPAAHSQTTSVGFHWGFAGQLVPRQVPVNTHTQTNDTSVGWGGGEQRG